MAVPASMLAQQNSKVEKEVRAVLDELHQANMKGGPEVVPIFDKYIADDVVRIPPNGALITKAEMLEGFRTGKLKVQKGEMSDLRIHIYGNTAVATGIENSRWTMMGTDYSGQFRWARVLVKRNGIWKSVLFTNTKTEPAKQ
jgi:hypothetical protein